MKMLKSYDVILADVRLLVTQDLALRVITRAAFVAAIEPEVCEIISY